jgi:hypothetical protein
MHPLRPLIVLPFTLLAGLGACRVPHVPATASSGCHPACAGATTTSVGDAGAALRGSAAQAPPALERATPAPSAKAYLCPMHLTFGADEPGRCPECNMKLVPRAQALEHDHGR